MDNPRDFPVEGEPDVCPKCDPRSALVAGLPSAQMGYLDEPFFTKKKKQWNHHRNVTFTTDFKECRSPTRPDLKSSIFKPGYQRVCDPNPVPTSYSTSYPWSAPAPPSPRGLCRDHSPVAWRRPVPVYSPRPRSATRVPQSAYVDPAIEERRYTECECTEPPFAQGYQVPLRLQSPPKYCKRYLSHHEQDRGESHKGYLKKKSFTPQRTTDQRKQVEITAHDEVPRMRTRKVSKSPNPQPYTGSTRRMTREDRPRHADLAAANKKRREEEAKVRVPYVSPLRELYQMDFNNRKNNVQGTYDTHYNQNYKDWVSLMHKKKMKDTVRFGTPSPIRDPSDPRFLKHHNVYRPKAQRNTQWKTSYTTNYEKPMKRFYGSKKGVVSHMNRPPQGESDTSTSYTADTDEPWYNQYVETNDRAALHRWKGQRTNFEMKDFFSPLTPEQHEACLARRPSPGPTSYSRPQDTAPYPRPQDTAHYSRPQDTTPYTTRPQDEQPSESSATSNMEVQEPAFKRTQRRPPTPSSKRVEALDLEDVEDYEESTSENVDAERQPAHSIMKGLSPQRVRAQSPPPPDQPQFHGNRERQMRYDDHLISSRPEGKKERYDIDKNYLAGPEGKRERYDIDKKCFTGPEGKRERYDIDKNCLTGPEGKRERYDIDKSYLAGPEGRRERYDIDKNCLAGQHRRIDEGKLSGKGEYVTEYDIIGSPSMYEPGTYIKRAVPKADPSPSRGGRLPTPELVGFSKVRHHLDMTTPNQNGILHPASSECVVPSPHQGTEYKPHLRSTAPIYPAPPCSKIIDDLEEKLIREDTEMRNPRVVTTSNSPYHRNCARQPPNVGKKDSKKKLHTRVADSTSRKDPDSSSCHACGQPTRSRPLNDVAANPEPDTTAGRARPRTGAVYKRREKKSMRPASVGRGALKTHSGHQKAGNAALKSQQKKKSINTKALADQLYSKPLPQFVKSHRKEQPSSPTVRTFKDSLSNPKGQTCCVGPQGGKNKENDYKSHQEKTNVPIYSVFSNPSSKGVTQPCQVHSTEERQSSSLSNSNCSVISDLLEKAKNRRDQFWNSRSHHPQE